MEHGHHRRHLGLLKPLTEEGHESDSLKAKIYRFRQLFTQNYTVSSGSTLCISEVPQDAQLL
jgi:hypothetical protein